MNLAAAEHKAIKQFLESKYRDVHPKRYTLAQTEKMTSLIAIDLHALKQRLKAAREKIYKTTLSDTEKTNLYYDLNLDDLDPEMVRQKINAYIIWRNLFARGKKSVKDLQKYPRTAAMVSLFGFVVGAASGAVQERGVLTTQSPAPITTTTSNATAPNTTIPIIPPILEIDGGGPAAAGGPTYAPSHATAVAKPHLSKSPYHNLTPLDQVADIVEGMGQKWKTWVMKRPLSELLKSKIREVWSSTSKLFEKAYAAGLFDSPEDAQSVYLVSAQVQAVTPDVPKRNLEMIGMPPFQPIQEEDAPVKMIESIKDNILRRAIAGFPEEAKSYVQNNTVDVEKVLDAVISIRKEETRDPPEGDWASWATPKLLALLGGTGVAALGVSRRRGSSSSFPELASAASAAASAASVAASAAPPAAPPVAASAASVAPRRSSRLAAHRRY
jgi:hypothetical protein